MTSSSLRLSPVATRALACVLVAFLAFSPRARGDDTERDIATARSLSRAFQSVARRVEPAVVHITQFSRVIRRDFFGFPLERGNGQLMQTGLGSGVIVSREGFILTNNHVAAGSETLKVKLYDGKEFEARLVGRDPLTDIAVLKIDPAAIPEHYAPPAFADADAIEVGEWVVAIGSPFGFDNTVTAGIVSAKGRSLAPSENGTAYQDFIQTDAAINPGNSGGPLLNLDGKLVGINTAIAGPTRGFHGLSFAIPANMAKTVMDNIIKNGRVIRGALGVSFAEAARDARGVAVMSVVEDGPAEKAGLRAGDVITRFDGRQLSEPRLRTAISLTAPGTEVPLEILRAGTTQTLRVTIGDQTTLLGVTRLEGLGALARSFPESEAQEKFGQKFSGAVVVQVDPQGRAADAGLQIGDIILQVRHPIAARRALNVDSAETLQKLTDQADYSRGVRLGVIRGTQQGFIDVTE